MLRSLAFIAVRKQEHDAARPLPLGLATRNKLVDYHLRAVREIAKLRLPDAKHAGIIERVAVIEAEDRRFGKEGIVDAELRLFLRQVFQRRIRRIRFHIVEHGVAMAERTTLAI